MSADNEIAIVQFPNNTFRLVMLGGCPDVTEIEKYMEIYVKYLKPEIYDTYEDAFNDAQHWEDEEYVEYGITSYKMQHNLEHYLKILFLNETK